MSPTDPNRVLIATVAKRLGDLRERVAFVGGAAIGLLLTDPAAPPVRQEDFIAVIDGRVEIVEEARAAPADIAAYLRREVSTLLDDVAFCDAVPGHLPADQASQARSEIVLGRLAELARGVD